VPDGASEPHVPDSLHTKLSAASQPGPRDRTNNNAAIHKT